MRFAFILFAFALATVSFVGCGQKKNTGDIIARKAEKPKVSSPVRMQEYSQSKTVNWAGGSVVCEIRRTACDSLPMVKDEVGQKFVDNTIALRIRRSDGSTFLERTFTKASFDDALDDDYRRTGILEGFVFDRVEGSCLRFAASVCHPQTDEYIPLVVEVSRSGGISISRDTQLDTSGADAAGNHGGKGIGDASEDNDEDGV